MLYSVHNCFNQTLTKKQVIIHRKEVSTNKQGAKKELACKLQPQPPILTSASTYLNK